MIRILTILISTFLAFFALLANAQNSGFIIKSASDLMIGDSYYDVLKIIGSPDKKIENQKIRSDIWKYPKVNLFFKDGLLEKIDFKNKNQSYVPKKEEKSIYKVNKITDLTKNEKKLDDKLFKEAITEFIEKNKPDQELGDEKKTKDFRKKKKFEFNKR